MEALEGQGYKVERIARIGKSSVRRITMNGVSKIVSIRTTQDTWIAFPRNKANKGWSTLEDVDFVVAASVDNPDDPRFAKIHLMPADDMRARFNWAVQLCEAREGWTYADATDESRPVGVALFPRRE